MSNHSETEVPLAGGNVNTEVVRVANTVRRATGAQSDNVHKLLQHLATEGFEAAPQFLGIDEKGREILSFIEGECGYPEYIWHETRLLIAATQMLRAYHDASLGLTGVDPSKWVYNYPDKTRHEVICHNDFAPYNMIFRDKMPVGIIDFDLAGPGPRLRDIAYLAYWFTPLSFSSDDLTAFSVADIEGGSKRLKLICQTYGIEPDRELLEMVVAFVRRMSNEAAAVGMIGAEATERLKEGGNLDYWSREAVALEARLEQILQNFGDG